MPLPSTSRLQLVRQATETWRKNLLDTTGRNRLRRYRDLKTGTLDLTPGMSQGLDARILDRMFANRVVKLSDLLSRVSVDPAETPPFDDGCRRLTAIYKTALTNSEEKGIETLFAAVGIATWDVDSGSAPNAPVILIPLDAETTGAAARDFNIRIAGDVLLNPVLAHILRTEHDIETDEDEADVAEEPPSNFAGYSALLNLLKQSWSALPNLIIEHRIIIAIFSYSTMPLVADLEMNAELFAESDIIAAMAGDAGARSALANRICDPDPNRPDIDPPSEEFLILDADSSQNIAINRVLGGESIVIQGPPGTGKSQTIANLVATLIARGKRVLFVAEKRAAIEAVTKRLEHAGLIDFVLDLHGGVTSRRDFARTLNDSLKQVSQIPARDFSALHACLQESRASLSANDAALHEPRCPWKLSVFEMRSRLLGIPEDARTQIRLSTDNARAIDWEEFDRLERGIVEWVDLGGHRIADDNPEWSRSGIKTTEAAHEAFELVSDLAHRRLPTACANLFSTLDALQITKPETVSEWIATTDFLTIASGSWWGRTMAQIFSKKFRATKRALDTSSALSLAQDRAQNLQEDADALFLALDELKSVTELGELDKMPLDNLVVALERMASNRTTVANLPRIRELEDRFIKTGIANVIELVGKDILPEYAVPAVEHAWLKRILDDLEFDDSLLAAFDGISHSRHLGEYIDADREHRDSTSERVRRLVSEGIIATMNQYPDETSIVRREAAKKSRHLSVRQLLSRAPHVLSTLRPCWTMSPIIAAEMISAGSSLFDIVIFDEASQIPPAEAIGCLARAPQSVIAGDSRQLPPTSFFGRSEDSDNDIEDDFSLTNDIESLLDAADVLLRDQMLQWHYRSRDDRLIAFSNNHIYGGALTAFPSSIVSPPISHCLVPFLPTGQRVSGTRSNPDEVAKVVDLVLEHAKETPNETLGVIAFGQHHADNIENVLMRRLNQVNDSSLNEFFSVRNEERFFVKNIERVQGDERDAIILSVGYHKDANGNLPYRFGPILQEGGERRLNVAVTRARSHLTLVSSFSHRDMAPGRSSAKGVELLRQYLEYADSGGNSFGADVIDVPLNPFELSVKDGLERRGIPVTPQYGVSGYRIDFACAHPDEPGRMVLAVESDGASYHSVPTARDRDRLRQQVLESKGWRFHRIWSTAWMRDREAELDKVEQSWKQAVDAVYKNELPFATTMPKSTQKSDLPPQRAPRPKVPRRGDYGYDNITDYSHAQLVSLVQWIQSDTLLRTEDELIREMIRELGFKRSGARIDYALKHAIEDARV